MAQHLIPLEHTSPLTTAPDTWTPNVCLKISLVAQTVKHLPAMQETWVQSLGREDPLEKEMATDSSTLAWRIPWTEEPSKLQSMEVSRPEYWNG